MADNFRGPLKVEQVVRLLNARKELVLLLKHLPHDNHRTRVALACGVLNHAIEFVLTGKIKTKRGLYTALLQAD